MTNLASGEQSVLFYTGRGVTSRSDVAVEVSQTSSGSGIVFVVTQGQLTVKIPAQAQYVVSTLRNVVLGLLPVRLCLVEHFLAAASLYGLNNLLVTVDGMELPLGDGSASFWLDAFAAAGWKQSVIEPTIELDTPIVCRNGDRMLLAVPDDKFSVSYHMDWDHPLIGKCWQSWETSSGADAIAGARTFGKLSENKLLGLENEVVSLTADGFTQELRWRDEPVRHKLLDLIGDLTLSGCNPLAFKARFVSIKAGHELDVQMARQLSEIIKHS